MKFDATNELNAQNRDLRPKMFAINTVTLEKYFHNISHKTDVYQPHSIQNNTRDGEWKKNDLSSDS